MSDKMAFKRREFVRLSVAAAAASLSPRTFSQSRGASPIKLGMVTPVTGRFASYGASAIPGAMLAAKLINGGGGIASLGGAPIELVIVDTKGDAKVTVAETERLINEEKVVGIVGPFSSLDALAANPLSDQYRIPFVSPFWSSEKAFTLNSRYSRTLNLVSSSYASGGVNMLKVLRAKYGLARKVALVYDSGEYGKGASAAARPLLEAAGMVPVLDLPVTPGASDYGPTILRIRDSGADTILAGFYFQESVLLLRAADSLNFRAPIVGMGSGFTDVRLPGALGPEVAARALKAPVFGTATGMRLDTKYAPLQKLLKASESESVRPGNTPGIELQWYGLAAQAVNVFRLGLEQAASRDGVNLNNAIAALKLARGSDTMVSPFYDPAIAWDQAGKPLNQVPSIEQWQDGKAVIVYPDDVATGGPRI